MLPLPSPTLLAYLGALAATLLLAAVLTPACWWKRPNLLAAFVLAGGTWGLGGLALQWFAASPARAATPLAAASTRSADQAMQAVLHGAAELPLQRFITCQDVNLRSGPSTASRRLAVVPIGAEVGATGLRDGDWWQVSATVDGAALTGWASSLWLRRTGEYRH